MTVSGYHFKMKKEYVERKHIPVIVYLEINITNIGLLFPHSRILQKNM